MIDLSIVVVNWNVRDLLQRLKCIRERMRLLPFFFHIAIHLECAGIAGFEMHRLHLHVEDMRKFRRDRIEYYGADLDDLMPRSVGTSRFKIEDANFHISGGH